MVEERGVTYLYIAFIHNEFIVHDTQNTKKIKIGTAPSERADVASPATGPGYVGRRRQSRDPPREPGYTSVFY